MNTNDHADLFNRKERRGRKERMRLFVLRRITVQEEIPNLINLGLNGITITLRKQLVKPLFVRVRKSGNIKIELVWLKLKNPARPAVPKQNGSPENVFAGASVACPTILKFCGVVLMHKGLKAGLGAPMSGFQTKEPLPVALPGTSVFTNERPITTNLKSRQQQNKNNQYDYDDKYK